MLIIIAMLQAAATQPLNLTCMGAGTANKLTVTNVYGSGGGYGTVGATPYSYSGSGNATAYGSRQQEFTDQVDVRLFAGDDRIRGIAAEALQVVGPARHGLIEFDHRLAEREDGGPRHGLTRDQGQVVEGKPGFIDQFLLFAPFDRGA